MDVFNNGAAKEMEEPTLVTRTMKMILISILSSVLILYLFVCAIAYLYQEKLIFFPATLSKEYTFQFQQAFEELFIPAADGTKLHGILFKTKAPKGLIFYLHGNGGAIDSWGGIAQTYTRLGYDLFILDYRGYGKSEGTIQNEKQFYGDVQYAYNKLKEFYAEECITIIGYSIGTGAAAMLAASNKPVRLILQAPYYSLKDIVSHLYPYLPTAILKYKFETFRFIKKVQAPIVIFHGTKDEVIYFGSSLKLKKLLKSDDVLIPLEEQGHNGITENFQYQLKLQNILLHTKHIQCSNI